MGTHLAGVSNVSPLPNNVYLYDCLSVRSCSSALVAVACSAAEIGRRVCYLVSAFHHAHCPAHHHRHRQFLLENLCVDSALQLCVSIGTS